MILWVFEIHQNLLLSTDTKITICKHQVDSIWLGLVCYLYCTAGFNCADTFNFVPFFDSRFRTGPALTPGAHHLIILNHWLWTTFGNVTNFSFNLFSTGTGTNSSLNEQCTNVIIIIKLWWQELSLKQHVPLVQKYDTNHRHDAQSAQGNLLFALRAFLNNNMPLKEKNWWNWLCANAPSTLKASTLWYNVQINFLLTW